MLDSSSSAHVTVDDDDDLTIWQLGRGKMGVGRRELNEKLCIVFLSSHGPHKIKACREK